MKEKARIEKRGSLWFVWVPFHRLPSGQWVWRWYARETWGSAMRLVLDRANLCA